MNAEHGGGDLLVTAGGRQWRLRRSADLETLWEQLGEKDFADERIPYWTELWPASLALAAWLREQPLAGKICLDLGCGLGLTAMLAASLDAKVLACDYESAALLAARQNAALNGIGGIRWLCMDWRAPCLAPASLDYIWAADILYERRSMEPVLALLARAIAPHGDIWIAEPGRAIFLDFLELARNRGWQAEAARRERVRAIRPQASGIDVTVWRLRPPLE